MRSVVVALVFACAGSSAFAQQPPPKISPFVVDVRGSFPAFPSDSEQLAHSRAVNVTDLPGRGKGLEAGFQIYLFKWRGMTIGVGGSVYYASANADPNPAGVYVPPKPGTPPPKPGTPPPDIYSGLGVATQFVSFAPQLSFNFGNGLGWSYISAGLGESIWSTVPGTNDPTDADKAHLKTINYGGGARWFKKKHVGYTFDVRFYAVNPGIANGAYGLSPRMTLLVISGGVSLK